MPEKVPLPGAHMVTKKDYDWTETGRCPKCRMTYLTMRKGRNYGFQWDGNHKYCDGKPERDP